MWVVTVVVVSVFWVVVDEMQADNTSTIDMMQVNGLVTGGIYWRGCGVLFEG